MDDGLMIYAVFQVVPISSINYYGLAVGRIRGALIKTGVVGVYEEE